LERAIAYDLESDAESEQKAKYDVDEEEKDPHIDADLKVAKTIMEGMKHES
jgi:hypothetical protein